jgi:hypothetical protein
MAGPDMEALTKANLMVGPNFQIYMLPTDAHGSKAIQILNPTQLFPAPTATRAFPGVAPHLIAHGKPDLSAKDFYTLILAADMGVNFYARENNPHSSQY